MRHIASLVLVASLVGCSSGNANEDPTTAGGETAEDIGSVSSAVCGTATASWASFPAGNGSQQCVTGVRIFYQNKFGAFVPPASGGPVGACARYGACNIWVNPANRPSSAKWNRYTWGGTEKPQKYDMVVFTASSAHPYGHIASVDHYSAGRLWVMDSNYSPWAGRKAACVHDTAGHTPYGFYRLKSLEPKAAPATPAEPTACHSSAGGFSFACDGAVKDETCVQITESADTAWKNDYFCSEDADVGMKWSEKGPIAGMTCTNITQSDAAAKTATAWKDNYLCVPPDSQYKFSGARRDRSPTRRARAGTSRPTRRPRRSTIISAWISRIRRLRRPTTTFPSRRPPPILRTPWLRPTRPSPPPRTAPAAARLPVRREA